MNKNFLQLSAVVGLSLLTPQESKAQIVFEQTFCTCATNSGSVCTVRNTKAYCGKVGSPCNCPLPHQLGFCEGEPYANQYKSCLSPA